MMHSKLISTGVLAVCLAAPHLAICTEEISPAFRQDVLDLMKLTGASNLGTQMGTAIAQQMVNSMQQSNPAVPLRVIDITNEVVADFIKRGVDATLLDKVIPVYAKHFTQKDIRGMVAFYRTPLGQKMIAALPTVMQESIQLGQEWGERETPAMVAELKKRLAAEGFIRNDSPAPAPAGPTPSPTGVTP
jgi:hypothetical protein